MKKIVSIEKELNFPSMVGDVTSISLDNSLDFVDKSNIEGNLIVSGTYKMTEASSIEEKFEFNIPIDIVLTEVYDLTDAKISIDDFNYKILNNDTLVCKIDILIEALEEVILEDEELVISEIEENLVRECDGDKQEMDENINIVENVINDKKNEEVMFEKEDITEEIIDQDASEQGNKNISSLFENLSNSDETFATYSVYIYRKEDTLEKILDKYNVTKEMLSNYNDLNNIEIGTKIIIPTAINE